MPLSKEAKKAYDRKRYQDNREKRVAEQKSYYLKNRTERIAYINAYTIDNKRKKVALVREYKKRPCMDCGGIFHFTAMDFDHREGEKKSAGIAVLMMNRRVGMIALQREIDKCDIVCANCHRVRTYNRLPRRYQLEEANEESEARVKRPRSVLNK